MSKDALEEQFDNEKPVQVRIRRLADWINPTGPKKNHSLIDKVYQKEHLSRAWVRIPGHVDEGFRQNLNKDSGDVNEGFREKVN